MILDFHKILISLFNS